LKDIFPIWLRRISLPVLYAGTWHEVWMSDVSRAPILDQALNDDEAALPALLELLVISAGADGAMVSVGAGTQQQTVLSSMPSGLGGRQQQLSAELLATCGKGITPTGRMLLPVSLLSWLGFLPKAVCSVRVTDDPGALIYLFFWWREMPVPHPSLPAIERQGILLLRSFAGRYGSALRLLRLQERLDTVLLNVSLGIVFMDLLAGSLLNPLAAEWLGLPVETRETAKVVAAMRRVQNSCTVVPGESSEEDGQKGTTEYWIWEKRGLVLRVESHPMGEASSPGRFWVFTDVKPLWDSGEKLKSANKVLQRNIGLLAEEMQRRMEAEEELRRYNLGLKEQNAELEIGKLQSDLLANQDAVTGLANGRRFRSGLEELLAEARRDGDRVAVLFLDLDRFKAVNDICGHEQGDVLLRKVGEILTTSLRRDDVVARMGGDEFTCAMKVKGDEGYADLTATTERLCDALRIDVDAPGHAIQVSASIGLAVFPEDAGDSASLLRAADNAMYLAKRGGGRGVVFFGESRGGFGPESAVALSGKKKRV
jgi:diguanylate cyclase (GGDEF)-like protein